MIRQLATKLFANVGPKAATAFGFLRSYQMYLYAAVILISLITSTVLYIKYLQSELSTQKDRVDQVVLQLKESQKTVQIVQQKITDFQKIEQQRQVELEKLNNQYIATVKKINNLKKVLDNPSVTDEEKTKDINQLNVQMFDCLNKTTRGEPCVMP